MIVVGPVAGLVATVLVAIALAMGALVELAVRGVTAAWRSLR